MKNKGFTVIELLATIIVLSVISLIIVPLILNSVQKIKKDAAVASAYSHISSIEKNLVANKLNLDDTNYENGKKYFLDKNSSFNLEEDENSDIYISNLVEVSGNKATDGYVIFDNGIVKSAVFVINGYEIKCDNNICKYYKEHQVIEKKYITDGNQIMYNYELSNTVDLTNLANSDFNGVLNGATITNEGILFDGVNDSVAVGKFNHDNITYDVTFKIDGFSSNSQVIAGNLEAGGCALVVGAGADYIRGNCYIDGEYRTVISNPIKSNQLYTAALTYDGKSLKLYLDGVMQDKYENSSGISEAKNDTVLMLGANPNGTNTTDSYLKGYIYSARFYNRALTQDEININYEIDNLRYNSIDAIDLDRKIVLKYEFDNKSNTSSSLYDLTGNGNKGTISLARLSDRGLMFEGYYNNSSVKIDEINNENFTNTVVFKPMNIKFDKPVTIMGNVENGGCSITLTKNNQLRGQCYIGDGYTFVYYDNIEYEKVYNVSLTYDGKSLSLYVNGNMVDELKSDGSLVYPENNTILVLGGNPNKTNVTTELFNGIIYYTDVYSRAITKSEVNYLHNSLNNKYGKYDGHDEQYGLLVNYKYDNNQNTATVLKNIGNTKYNGEIVGATKTENGIYFDGDNDYVRIGQINTSEITYDVTFKLLDNEAPASTYIIANIESGGCGIYFTPSTMKITGTCYIDGAYQQIRLSQNVVEYDKIYNAVLTYDGETLNFYLDGNLITPSIQNSVGITYPENSTILALGTNPSRNNGASSYFAGYIYDVKVYSRALSLDEIKA